MDVRFDGNMEPIYNYSPWKDRKGNLLDVYANVKQIVDTIPEGISTDLCVFFPLIKSGSTRWKEVYNLRGHILVHSPEVQLSFTSVRHAQINQDGPYQEHILHMLVVNGRVMFSRCFIHEDVNF